jgi:hypothetical protein
MPSMVAPSPAGAVAPGQTAPHLPRPGPGRAGIEWPPPPVACPSVLLAAGCFHAAANTMPGAIGSWRGGVIPCRRSREEDCSSEAAMRPKILPFEVLAVGRVSRQVFSSPFWRRARPGYSGRRAAGTLSRSLFAVSLGPMTGPPGAGPNARSHHQDGQVVPDLFRDLAHSRMLGVASWRNRRLVLRSSRAPASWARKWRRRPLAAVQALGPRPSSQHRGRPPRAVAGLVGQGQSLVQLPLDPGPCPRTGHEAAHHLVPVLFVPLTPLPGPWPSENWGTWERPRKGRTMSRARSARPPFHRARPRESRVWESRSSTPARRKGYRS